MASCPEVCGSELSERPQSVVDSSCHGFGVRSYLHHFYEECTASMRDQQEDFQTQTSSHSWSSGLWKASLAFGAVVLGVGLVVLMVGYAIPPRIEAFGEGELLFVDQQAVRYNQGLHLCVLTGTGMLSLGGLIMAGAILLSAFSRHPAKDEETKGDPTGRERRTGTRGRMGTKISNSVTITKSPTAVSGEGVTLPKIDSVQPTP